MSGRRILLTGGSGFIGTNFIDLLDLEKVDVLNLDTSPPNRPEYETSYRECSILDVDEVNRHFAEFAPTEVLHLAALVDSHFPHIDDYEVNTDGSQHIIEAVANTQSVERFVLTSTQFVCGPGYIPAHDEDFNPHTVYGESKAITERALRKASPGCTWTIIRPTNVWGPFHPRYPHEFWRVVKKGMYFHPGRKPVMRSYGYVGNVVHQVNTILSLPKDQAHEQVLYVGDAPVELFDWANGFSVGITGRSSRVVPRAFIRCLGVVGDCLGVCGVKFPITTSRYKSMTQDYVVPMDRTFNLLGDSPHTLQEGIDITVDWFNRNGRD